MDDCELERLLKLTGEIYDAALDASLWPEVLRNSCVFAAGSAANLFFQEIGSRSASLLAQWGNDPHYERLYLDRYYKLNPILTGQFLFEVGRVHTQADIISDAEFHKTRFYREWVQPQGVVDVVGANLERSSTHFAVLAIRLHERDGRANEETRRRVGLIVPHFRRAVAIGRLLEFHSGVTAAMTKTLDALSACVLLVDDSARITFVNSAGQALLAQGNVIRTVRGGLVVRNGDAHRLLLDAIASAARGDAALGLKGAAIPLVELGDERWIAHVLALTSGARRRSGSMHAATAAIFIRKAGMQIPSAIGNVAKLYRLTPTEIRVLHAVIEIGGTAAVGGRSRDLGGDRKDPPAEPLRQDGGEAASRSREADRVRL